MEQFRGRDRTDIHTHHLDFFLRHHYQFPRVDFHHTHTAFFIDVLEEFPNYGYDASYIYQAAESAQVKFLIILVRATRYLLACDKDNKSSPPSTGRGITTHHISPKVAQRSIREQRGSLGEPSVSTCVGRGNAFHAFDQIFLCETG